MDDAIVLGGGIVGGAIALALQRRGLSTLVVDPEIMPPAASWGNAGHIAVEQVEPLASWATIRSVPQRLFGAHAPLSLPLRDISAWLPFALRLMQASSEARFREGKVALSNLMSQAMPAWRRFVAALDSPQLLREEGHFIVWGTAASAAAGRRNLQASISASTATFRDADSNELAMLTMLMGRPPAGAVRVIGSGQISDHDDLARAMKEGFGRYGGRHLRASAVAIEVKDRRASVTLNNGDRLQAGVIVVAAGVASRELMAGAGYRVPMIAERGYHVQSTGERWPLSLPPVVFEDRSLIVTRFRTRVRASSFLELAHADSPADPRKWQRLWAHIDALRLPIERPGGEWMGCRPTLPDYLPAIGHSERAANLLYAFGHQHLGLTLAPITGEIVAALAGDYRPPVSAAAFDLERFRGWA
jgi:D-hydroxyproline dehydrogenase